MMKHIIYLALGTNLGDRRANLRAAIAVLPPAVTVLVESPIYETPPWGITDQPAFLNMALKGETLLAPLALLSLLKRRETQLGRTPSIRYGPRQIDMDILFYAGLILDTPELVIPHPRLQERAFALVPLADIAPDYYHPVLEKTVREMLASCDTSGVKLYEQPD
ncbi:MAG: 2-amino-4-hydroxy-6-hydroxymethyldihydropteridine diphosphokinase [Anaerolineales bacterium]|nr:2-amino-4-hydroxy-6-hydroxymethyldihydropteridine diphosphokinase [Anaerolineales bacterium]